MTLSLEQKLCGGKCLVHARGRRSQWADWLETDGRRQQFNKLLVFRRRSAVAFEEREVTERRSENSVDLSRVTFEFKRI